jgi:hypothetical protein
VVIAAQGLSQRHVRIGVKYILISLQIEVKVAENIKKMRKIWRELGRSGLEAMLTANSDKKQNI